MNDYLSAFLDYNIAIGLNRNYAEAYNGRGLAYYARGDYNSAISDYETALRIKPNYTPAKDNLDAVLGQR